MSRCMRSLSQMFVYALALPKQIPKQVVRVDRDLRRAGVKHLALANLVGVVNFRYVVAVEVLGSHSLSDGVHPAWHN